MTDTIVLTIDNLGEAAELEQGRWPAGAPRGQHPSVTQVLPRLLDLLDAIALRATFFVEAVNTRDYPAALLEIAARGHELGFHAWRHERWANLSDDDEQDVIDRSFAAYAQLGLDVRAFRPPGGGLNRHTTRRLRAAGVSWCSAKGERAGVDDAGMAHLPFRWDLVDATYLHRPFAGLRAERGLPARPLAPQQAVVRLTDELGAEPDPTAATLVLHPFLMAGDAAWSAYEGLLRELAGRAAAGAVRVLPGGLAAAGLLGRHAAPLPVVGSSIGSLDVQN
ncbi:MAG: polysaccharide deacetylase family protein [Solirubrobacteraceae bacterium]|nr:polysaccharide deacetylase family protein [Solirubrobacteraceae bacterium]